MEFGLVNDTPAAIGVLFMARGFGSGFGPIAGRPLMENMTLRPYLLGIAIAVCGALYIGVSMVAWGAAMLALVFFSHAASGLNWVLSTTLLQERTTDEWRGRVAGTDHFGITLMMGLSAASGGWILENELMGMRELIALTGLVQIILGLGWIVLISGEEKRMLEIQTPI
jgi:MFS family permease